jgi:hypothetical protein
LKGGSSHDCRNDLELGACRSCLKAVTSGEMYGDPALFSSSILPARWHANVIVVPSQPGGDARSQLFSYRTRSAHPAIALALGNLVSCFESYFVATELKLYRACSRPSLSLGRITSIHVRPRSRDVVSCLEVKYPNLDTHGLKPRTLLRGFVVRSRKACI